MNTGGFMSPVFLSLQINKLNSVVQFAESAEFADQSGLLLLQATTYQQRFYLRFTSAEITERFKRVHAATLGQ